MPQQQCAFELTQDVGRQSLRIGGLDAEMPESAVGEHADLYRAAGNPIRLRVRASITGASSAAETATRRNPTLIEFLP